MQDDATRKPTQGWLPLECESDLGVYNLSTETPTQNMEMMERIVAPSNIRAAYRRVKRNDGCPGVDGMTVEELLELLRNHWQQIRKALLDGTYTPSPVKRHELPKPGGGVRVLQSVSNFLTKKLKLKVNRDKSRVAKPRHRSLLGFSIGKAGRVFVSDKSIRRLKDRIRALTGRNRGRRIEQIIREVAGYRELRKRGVSRDLAWNTCKSHHGPWRLSRSPALAYALTTRYFVEQGLPLLHVNV